VTCDWCLAETAKRPRKGRQTSRHKCQHGCWCPRADPLRQHDNHYPMGGRSCCDECRSAYWARERERVRLASVAAAMRRRKG
jgi:hypothetical protein